MRTLLVFTILSGVTFLVFGDEQVESFRYLRPAEAKYQLETEIAIQKRAGVTSITSVTHRARTRLTLSTNYGSNGQLRDAHVTVITNGEQQRAAVRNAKGKAEVTREDGQQFELEIPTDVIVTSAPDWTDAFSLMRRYDTAAGGTQEFAGLWIHPTREPLRLTFSVQHLGVDSVPHKGATQQLDRLLITLRGGSRYIAWRDKQHRLIRLVPAESDKPAIVLAGWEVATAALPLESE